jgi:hypothetical protein
MIEPKYIPREELPLLLRAEGVDVGKVSVGFARTEVRLPFRASVSYSLIDPSNDSSLDQFSGAVTATLISRTRLGVSISAGYSDTESA